jgi:SAM-dependent methyltransferase
VTRPDVPTGLKAIRSAVSYRRHLLDAYLRAAAPLMRGAVLDLGGKRVNRRGRFVPPKDAHTQWTYANIDETTSPDLLCDAASVPLPDASVDCIVCTEVLEHVPDPSACVREAIRLLRPGGVFIASVPFFYPIHNDPFDYRRFTAEGLERLHAGFTAATISNMGGYLGVLGMFIEFGRQFYGGPPLQRVLFEVGRLLQWWDARRLNAWHATTATRFTTGYFVIAEK